MKDKGNFEERWFTLLKLGEIHERFYQDWNKAKSFYEECAEADPERADSFFYLAQGHRLRNEPELALPYIDKGANLEIPERSLFHWLFLYNCLTKLEYGRIAIALSNPSLVDMKKAKLAMLKANCFGGTDAERKELEVLLSMVGHKIDELKGGKTSRTAIIEKCVRFMELFQNSPLAKNLPKRLIYQLDSLIRKLFISYFSLFPSFSHQRFYT